jgi:hypothetical protein
MDLRLQSIIDGAIGSGHCVRKLTWSKRLSKSYLHYKGPQLCSTEEADYPQINQSALQTGSAPEAPGWYDKPQKPDRAGATDARGAASRAGLSRLPQPPSPTAMFSLSS